MITPGLDLPQTLLPEGRERAVGQLRMYFAPATDRSGYTGSRFERLGAGGDHPSIAHEFTAEDIAAVSLLSVDVPGGAALEILENRRAELRELLKRIPTDLDLVDVDPAGIESGWTPWKLDSALRDVNGLGQTKTSKLMARKRPRLVPVYDRLVGNLLRPRGNWWAAINAELRRDDAALHRRLLSLRDEAGIGHDISPLRVLDVVAWLTAKGRPA